METEASQMAELGNEQKPGQEVNQNPIGNDVNPKQQTDEMPRSVVNEEPVETCTDTVLATEVNSEKQSHQKAVSEVDQKPMETCQDTVVVTEVNSEKQSCQTAISEVDQKPMETCQEAQESAVESDVNPENQIASPGVIYRCKRCRQMVATQEYVVTHEVGIGFELSFKTHKKSPVDKDDIKPECTSIFVEPIKWMQHVEEGYVAHKLFCAGCKARLGQFNWAGMKCSCGAWVIPAFQLNKSKIDECSM